MEMATAKIAIFLFSMHQKTPIRRFWLWCNYYHEGTVSIDLSTNVLAFFCEHDGYRIVTYVSRKVSGVHNAKNCNFGSMRNIASHI